MKSPSTVAAGGHTRIMPLSNIQTTPSSGSMPSTRESTSIMESKLPPIAARIPTAVRRATTPAEPKATCPREKPQRAALRIFWRLAVFAPKLVAGAADENVLQRRLAHRYRLNLPWEGLHDIGHEAVSPFALHADLIIDHGGLHMRARPDVIR